MLNGGGIKNIENNKKVRKTSIDVHTNYIKSESNTFKKDLDSRKSKNDIEKIKKNLIIDFMDFPESNKDGNINSNNYDLDEYLSLSAKPSDYNNREYIDSEHQSNFDKKKINSNEINKQRSSLLINLEKDFSDFNPLEKVKSKKKTSLLRRTTSVPKLIGCSNINEKLECTGVECRVTISELNSEENKNLNHKHTIITNQGYLEKQEQTYISHTEGENKVKSEDKDIEDENEILTELNSPYNELFFYLFENLLEEFMKSKFK